MFLTGTGDSSEHCSSFAAPITQDEQLERRLFDRINNKRNVCRTTSRPFSYPKWPQAPITMSVGRILSCFRTVARVVSTGGIAQNRLACRRPLREFTDSPTNVVLVVFLGYRDHARLERRFRIHLARVIEPGAPPQNRWTCKRMPHF